MTNKEFSDQFDILYNNIDSEQAPGLNSYEKSVFLTKAQDEMILTLYNGRNAAGLSFEATEEIRRYLNKLVKNKTFEVAEPNTEVDFNLDDAEHEVAFIVTESIKYATGNDCFSGKDARVQPVTLDEYEKVKNNPFRGITKYKAIRIDIGNDGTNDNCVKVIATLPIASYTIRYLTMPKPIILEYIGSEAEAPAGVDAPYDGLDLSIKEETEETSCELPESMHQAILQSAVNLAKVAWQTTVH